MVRLSIGLELSQGCSVSLCSSHIVLHHEACYDPGKLIISVFRIKLGPSRSLIPLDQIIPSLSQQEVLLDAWIALIEDKNELLVGLLEASTELHVHVTSEDGLVQESDPEHPVYYDEGDVDLAL